MRTQAQILRDCEKRFAELEQEAARRKTDPLLQRPCIECRHSSNRGSDGFEWYSPENISNNGTCVHPLVKGFRKWGVTCQTLPMPCGPEKALWEPQTFKQKVRTWARRHDAIIWGVGIPLGALLLVCCGVLGAKFAVGG